MDQNMNRYVIISDNLGIFLGFSLEDRTAFFSYDNAVDLDTIPALEKYDDAETVARLCRLMPELTETVVLVVPVPCAGDRATVEEIRAAGFDEYLGTLARPEWRKQHGNC